MASLQQQKRPSVSNWFSSLRRQPKNKKVNASNDKQFQRSCFDLSSANSTFYINPETTGLNGSCSQSGVDLGRVGTYGPESISFAKRQLVAAANEGNFSKYCSRCACSLNSAKASPESSLSSSSSATPTPTPSLVTPMQSPRLKEPLYVSKTTIELPASKQQQSPSYLYQHQQQLSQKTDEDCSSSPKDGGIMDSPSFLYNHLKELNLQQINAKNSSNCSSPSSLQTPLQSPKSPKSYLSSYFKENQSQANTPATSPSTPILKSQTVIETDLKKNIKVKMLPLPDAEKDPNTVLMHKRTEFTHSTTKTTTRTLIVSRPVELVLNDQGEVIARRPSRLSLEKKTRSNSVGCILDNDDNNDNAEPQHNSPDLDLTPTSPAVFLLNGSGKTLESVAGADDLRFIDDSSSATQSENDRNSENSLKESTQPQQNHKTEYYQQVPIRSATVSGRAYNNNNSKLYKNNNIYNHETQTLCDVCKDVVLRNRNNLQHNNEVIIRNKVSKRM